jgi:hypothetical protein
MSRGVTAVACGLVLTSALSAQEWNSRHWAAGAERSIAGRDPSDPTGWSLRRGNTDFMTVDGAGVMRMGGGEPRFYIDGTSATPRAFFRDVEFTGYHMRIGADGAAYGGFVVGFRSGAEGHGSAGDPCDANTYYLRLRHDGRWDIAKELRHPDAQVGKSGSLFAGGLPPERWLGMKALVRNRPDGESVRLELFVDSVSGGDTAAARWDKVGELVDSGQWKAPAPGCAYPESSVIVEGGGVVLVRNTGVQEVRYRHLRLREIAGPLGTRRPRETLRQRAPVRAGPPWLRFLGEGPLRDLASQGRGPDGRRLGTAPPHP